MKETFVQNAPLFSSLSLDEQSLIARAMKAQTVANGEQLLTQGLPVQQMYLIQSGWIKQTTVLDGGRTLVNNLGPGSLVAEMDALLDQPATSSAEAHSDVSLWSLCKNDLDQIIIQNPLVGLKFSNALGTRLKQVDRYLVAERLRGCALFADLSDEELGAIAEKLTSLELRQGSMIFRAAAPGEALFIVEAGQVTVSAPSGDSGEAPRTLGPGEMLGEMAVLASKPYDGAARASSECVLWMLRREDFAALTVRYPNIRTAMSVRLSQPLGPSDRVLAQQQLSKLALFLNLNAEVIDAVASVMLLRHFPAGERLFSAGDSGDSLIVVEKGEIQLVGDARLLTLRPGDYYGEMSLLTGKSRAESAIASTDCNVWVLERTDYDRLLARFPALGTQLSKAVSARLNQGSNSAFLTEQLRNIPLFASLSEPELQEIAAALYAQTYKRGDVIFVEGQRADAAYFIESGEVQLATRIGESYQMNFERMLAGDFFGEIALLAEGTRKSTARAVADETQLWVLYKSDFDCILPKYPQLASRLSKVLSERLARTDPRPTPPRPQGRPPTNGARPLAPRPAGVRPSSTPAVKRVSTLPDPTRPTPLKLKPVANPIPEQKPLRPRPANARALALSAPAAGGMPQATPVPARPQPRPMRERPAPPSRVAGTAQSRAVATRPGNAARTALVVAQPNSGALSVAVYNGMSWMKGRSLGFKFRVVALSMLFVWLCGITAPMAVLSAVNSPQSGTLAIGGIAVNLGDSGSANSPGAIATFTPTPPAASGSQKNAPQVVANARALPTRTPVRAAVRAGQPTPTRSAENPAPADAFAPTATPNVDFKLTKVRQLTPCENQGNHHIFALVLDANGNGIPNVNVEFIWDTGSFTDHTGQKVEYIPALGITNQTTPGYVNWPIYKGRTRVRVASGASDMTDWLRVDLPDQRCDANDNPIGNSLYHYSYLVVFQKAR